ncbi:MAG: PqqD family peptide modification chaperone [Fusobacteriaceae bacterium]
MEKYMLNNKILKQRIAVIPKKITIYDYLITGGKESFSSEDIFIIINFKKNIFKFNLFASLVLEEIEKKSCSTDKFIEKLSEFFMIEKKEIEKDLTIFLLELKELAIIELQYGN